MFKVNFHTAFSSAILSAAAAAAAPSNVDGGGVPLTNDNDGGSSDASHNPFVPKKLEAVYNSDPNQAMVESNQPPLLRSWKDSLSSKNELTSPTKTLRNSFSETSDGTADAAAHSLMTLDESAELGILVKGDDNFVPNANKKSVRRGLQNCGGIYPVIGAIVDFPVLVYACVCDDFCFDLGDCPYNVPLNCWNTSQITDMSSAFKQIEGASSEVFNVDISGWDVSSVTTMELMFYEVNYFNQPIGLWDVSLVENMGQMFAFAESFNQDISEWEVSKVTDMRGMFEGVNGLLPFATEKNKWNPNISSWDVSSVQDMSKMFYRSEYFDRPIGGWDVSSVTDMRLMFALVTDFNQPIGGWDVESVTDMESMFVEAKTFNQPLDEWDVSAVTSMKNMFKRALAFNQCLSTWAGKTGSVKTNSMFTDSLCPIAGSPAPNIGPWCQGAEQECYESIEPNECGNNPDPFTIVTSCEAVGALSADRRQEECINPTIAENCPGLCDQEQCPCENNPFPFVVVGTFTATCDDLAAESTGNQENFCNKYKNLRENCPGICTCGTISGDP